MQETFDIPEMATPMDGIYQKSGISVVHRIAVAVHRIGVAPLAAPIGVGSAQAPLALHH